MLSLPVEFRDSSFGYLLSVQGNKYTVGPLSAKLDTHSISHLEQHVFKICSSNFQISISGYSDLFKGHVLFLFEVEKNLCTGLLRPCRVWWLNNQIRGRTWPYTHLIHHPDQSGSKSQNWSRSFCRRSLFFSLMFSLLDNWMNAEMTEWMLRWLNECWGDWMNTEVTEMNGEVTEWMVRWRTRQIIIWKG